MYVCTVKIKMKCISEKKAQYLMSSFIDKSKNKSLSPTKLVLDTHYTGYIKIDSWNFILHNFI